MLCGLYLDEVVTNKNGPCIIQKNPVKWIKKQIDLFLFHAFEMVSQNSLHLSTVYVYVCAWACSHMSTCRFTSVCERLLRVEANLWFFMHHSPCLFETGSLITLALVAQAGWLARVPQGSPASAVHWWGHKQGFRRSKSHSQAFTASAVPSEFWPNLLSVPSRIGAFETADWCGPPVYLTCLFIWDTR